MISVLKLFFLLFFNSDTRENRRVYARDKPDEGQTACVGGGGGEGVQESGSRRINLNKTLVINSTDIFFSLFHTGKKTDECTGEIVVRSDGAGGSGRGGGQTGRTVNKSPGIFKDKFYFYDH